MKIQTHLSKDVNMKVIIKCWEIEVIGNAVVVNGKSYFSLNSNTAIMDFFEIAGKLLTED